MIKDIVESCHCLGIHMLDLHVEDIFCLLYRRTISLGFSLSQVPKLSRRLEIFAALFALRMMLTVPI
jgi:hypothetical protein